MQLPARTHYATLALLALAAKQDSPAPVTVREITAKFDIPGPFLVQILRNLRSVGWVQSTRGSQGGYRLATDPQKLTLLEIIETLGSSEATCTGLATGQSAAKGEEQLLQQAWEEAAAAWREVLAKTTIADILQRAHQSDQAMFYI
ncbi:HTH-type transcriptional regulator CymR [Stieleria bergensis]|uniref:HTH-type transcriptional regulator CymR n=1 Tax=Stieleria bergensis TaxID=2528025 RepID=A0A517SXK7_9BACT|nr:MAG: hypothetical protein CBB71_02365 [Rhodopirellula sp. TMED11]QDT60886.1 HTH-type transcriptional regulator CymR [Planctomycetes bacterium SV_7m_r]